MALKTPPQPTPAIENVYSSPEIQLEQSKLQELETKLSNLQSEIDKAETFGRTRGDHIKQRANELKKGVEKSSIQVPDRLDLPELRLERDALELAISEIQASCGYGGRAYNSAKLRILSSLIPRNRSNLVVIQELLGKLITAVNENFDLFQLIQNAGMPIESPIFFGGHPRATGITADSQNNVVRDWFYQINRSLNEQGSLSSQQSTGPTVDIRLTAASGRSGALGNAGDEMPVSKNLADVLVSQGSAVIAY